MDTCTHTLTCMHHAHTKWNRKLLNLLWEKQIINPYHTFCTASEAPRKTPPSIKYWTPFEHTPASCLHLPSAYHCIWFRIQGLVHGRQIFYQLTYIPNSPVFHFTVYTYMQVGVYMLLHMHRGERTTSGSFLLLPWDPRTLTVQLSHWPVFFLLKQASVVTQIGLEFVTMESYDYGSVPSSFVEWVI